MEGVALEFAGRAIGEKFGVGRGTVRIEVPDNFHFMSLKDLGLNLQP